MGEREEGSFLRKGRRTVERRGGGERRDGGKEGKKGRRGGKKERMNGMRREGE